MRYINTIEEKYKRSLLESKVIMNEINKSDVKFNPVVAPKTQKNDAEPVKNTPTVDIKQDYKEAAAAPGAEAVGRAQVMLNNVSKADMDTAKHIWENPAMIEKSDAMFNAAEKAGVPYPVAATFATQDVG